MALPQIVAPFGEDISILLVLDEMSLFAIGRKQPRKPLLGIHGPTHLTARIMQRIIGRDSGISKAFSSPPLVFGMSTSRPRQSMCSKRTALSAVGRHPLRRVRR